MNLYYNIIYEPFYSIHLNCKEMLFRTCFVKSEHYNINNVTKASYVFQISLQTHL